MRGLRRILEQDVLVQFAKAEFDSWRFGEAYSRLLSPAKAARLRAAPIESWSGQDRDDAETAVRSFRGVYIGPLFALQLAWYSGSLNIEELAEIRLIRMGAFAKIAPSRRLDDFVRALDAGNYPLGDSFGPGYRRLRPIFDPLRMQGHPVVIAEREGGPYTEVEGLTRLAVLLSKRLAGESVPEQIPAVLGVSDRLSEWRFY